MQIPSTCATSSNFHNCAGLITRLGALLLIPIMLGAIFMVHWSQWHFMPSETHPMGGMLFQVMILYIFVQGNEINAGKWTAEITSA